MALRHRRERPILPKMAGDMNGTENGSSSRDEPPERSRLKLLALILLPILLSAAQAQCSFMSGDDDDKEDGAAATPA